MDQRRIEPGSRPARSGEYTPVPGSRIIESAMNDLSPEADLRNPDERVVSHSPVELPVDRALERIEPDRLREIRRRLQFGLYASPAVLNEVACRMLESGDLD